MGRVDLRLHPDDAAFATGRQSGRALMRGWFRFAGTLVLIPRFEIGPVLDAIERYRCTIFSGVPTMYYALLQADVAGRDLSSLRVGISGGAAIPGEVIRAFEEA